MKQNHNDVTLRRYLREGNGSSEDHVSHVSKDDCALRHSYLEKELETAIKTATGRVEAHLKLWVLGSLLGAIIAILGGYTCTIVEVGAYREKIDNVIKQLDEVKKDLKENLDRNPRGHFPEG